MKNKGAFALYYPSDCITSVLAPVIAPFDPLEQNTEFFANFTSALFQVSSRTGNVDVYVNKSSRRRKFL